MSAPRLTRRELDGLWTAYLALQGECEGESDPERWRDLAAAERALRKIETSPLAPRPVTR